MADQLIPTHLTVRLVELPQRGSLAAAHNSAPDDNRELVIVALHVDDDPATARGWGECSALNQRGYADEWSRGAFDQLTSGHALHAAEHPMAAAALEMAHLDLALREAGRSLSDHLGTTGLSSVAGSVVGLGTLESKLDEIAALVADGYRRVKCKIVPEQCGDHMQVIGRTFTGIELHVDANGSFTSAEMAQLCGLADFGVTAIEQPFAVDDLVSARQLVEETEMSVIADEAISSSEDIDRIAKAGAATAVTIKPPKLGGLRSAQSALSRAGDLGLDTAIGGMLESGLGRHQLAALAPLPAFSLVGDLSPTGRWLADDPFDDIHLIDGRIAAPSSAGVAGDPDLDALDRYTIAERTVAYV